MFILYGALTLWLACVHFIGYILYVRVYACVRVCVRVRVCVCKRVIYMDTCV